MLQYISQPVTAFAQNCSIIWCDQSRKAAVIDPGGDIDLLLPIIDKHNLHVEKILLTHGHMDHVGGVAELKKHQPVPVIGPHEADNFWIQGLDMQAKMMGFGPVQGFTPDQWLNHGDKISVGEQCLCVIHCPGHTPGHVVFYSESRRLAFVGDVLFKGSIGRTDFPLGNHEQLLSSIRQGLFPLGDDVRFVPGHGPESTFGQERLSNPFVADSRYG